MAQGMFCDDLGGPGDDDDHDVDHHHLIIPLQASKKDGHGQSFWKEADTLAGLNHPNVLRFYGVVVDDVDECTVVGIMTEYMNRGSLSALLKARAAYLSLKERLDIALQVASGMAYLAKMDVVHV